MTTASFYKITSESLDLLFSDFKKKKIELIDLSKSTSDVEKACKPHFFPQTEKVVTFDIKDGGERVLTNDDDFATTTQKRFIFGANVCDAFAPHILDPLFNQEPKDRFYANRLENTLLAATLCDKKGVACFCDQVIPENEFLSAADMIFTKTDETTWAVKINGERVSNFLGDSFKFFIKDQSLEKTFKDKQSALFKSKNPEGSYQIPRMHELKEFLEKSFDSKIFDQESMNCIGCATCTYNCPTCHCFDISDEKTYFKGERRKNWDSCAFSLFTLHASGHNPRDSQGKRWRQRLMHKFSIYKDRFNKVACVGCGRCVRLCPAGVNMLEMFEKWKMSIDHL